MRGPHLGPWRALLIAAALGMALMPALPTLAQSQCNPIITIDAPRPNATVRGVTTFGGWAVDQSVPSGSGISSVQVVVDGLLGAGGTLLGTAMPNPRPDVDAALGRTGSYGFTLNADLSSLSPGPHSFNVYATTGCGPAYASVADTVQPAGPLLDVDVPTNGTTVSNSQTVDIGGWSSGTQVTVYLDGTAGQNVGSAPVNKPRPDVAQVMGQPSLANSGFDVVWQVSGLSNGSHTLNVQATGNGGSATQVIQLNVQGATAGSYYTYGSAYNSYAGGFTPSYNGYSSYSTGGYANPTTAYTGYCNPSYPTPNYLYPTNLPCGGAQATGCNPFFPTQSTLYPTNLPCTAASAGIYGGGYPYYGGGYYGGGYPYYGGGYYGGLAGSPVAAPTGVTITAVSTTTATITWTAVPGASSYTIFQSPTGVGAYTVALGPSTVPSATISSTTATIGGLTPGTTYYFAVAATGAGGTSVPTPTSPAAFSPTVVGGAVVVPVVTILLNPGGVGAAIGTCPAHPGPCVVQFSWTEPIPTNNTLTTGPGAPGAVPIAGCSLTATATPVCTVTFPSNGHGDPAHYVAISSANGTILATADTAFTM